MSLGHRKDIQGLRAFAIVGVFLFHIIKSGLPNGFIGVDVFFVISGYLITSILREKYSRNKFCTTIKSFYFSRLRRIAPLAATVILINFLASLFITTQIKETAFKLCREAVLAATFSANLVYLLFQPELFDETKWPTFLLHYCQTEYFAAHCWTHLRLWEFLIGTFVYLFVQLFNKKRKINTILPTQNTIDFQLESKPTNLIIISNLLSICLLALSLYFTASILVLNTFISEGEQEKLMLSHKYLVAVGDLSYPIYLVHFPIIAQLKQILGDANYEFELSGVLFIVLATIVMAKSLDNPNFVFFIKV
uniref:Acyltransferase 3 domain-containing protein n=1 Tax=Ditylenchus dipsaci TaxID=166011 RepID=A0A915CZ33_9BILA